MKLLIYTVHSSNHTPHAFVRSVSLITVAWLLTRKKNYIPFKFQYKCEISDLHCAQFTPYTTCICEKDFFCCIYLGMVCGESLLCRGSGVVLVLDGLRLAEEDEEEEEEEEEEEGGGGGGGFFGFDRVFASTPPSTFTMHIHNKHSQSNSGEFEIYLQRKLNE